MVLLVPEWRVLSYLAIMKARSENSIMHALAMDETILRNTLQQLITKKLVEKDQAGDVERYRITAEGKRRLSMDLPVPYGSGLD